MKIKTVETYRRSRNGRSDLKKGVSEREAHEEGEGDSSHLLTKILTAAALLTLSERIVLLH